MINKNKVIDPWVLVQNGEYDKAETIYLQDFEVSGRPLNLIQCGRIRLICSDLIPAINYFNCFIQETDNRLMPAIPYLFLGICYWILRDYEKVFTNWKMAFRVPYTDAAGGVEPPAMLLYAGLKLNDQGKIKVAKNRLLHFWKLHVQRQKRRSVKKEYSEEDFVHPGLLAWPGMIVPYLLGKIDEEDVIRMLEKKYQEPLRSRYTCQFDFYRGLVGLMNSNDQQFKDGMLKCANSNNGLLVHEYFLARWERDNNFPTVASGSPL
jgi:hypothetical protein